MELNKKIENLLNESSESSLVEKLNDVRKQVNESEVSKYNYYKLSELKNNFDTFERLNEHDIGNRKSYEYEDVTIKIE